MQKKPRKVYPRYDDVKSGKLCDVANADLHPFKFTDSNDWIVVARREPDLPATAFLRCQCLGDGSDVQSIAAVGLQIQR